MILGNPVIVILVLNGIFTGEEDEGRQAGVQKMIFRKPAIDSFYVFQ